MSLPRVSTKLIIIVLLVLLSLIPLGLIQFQIEDRESRRNEVVKEVGQSWGKPQEIIGPVLIVPYKVKSKSGKDTIEKQHKSYFLPESVNYECILNPQIRYRSLYEVVVYGMDLNVTGNFAQPVIDVPVENILWKEAYLTVGIPDLRGLNHKVKCQWDSDSAYFQPGVKDRSIYSSGIHLSLGDALTKEPLDSNYHFSFTLNVNGSNQASFAPIGKETKLIVSSSWNDPSFFGSYLPNSRTINKSGFNAKWELSYFSRNYPQSWSDNEDIADDIRETVYDSMFGVELFYPVDIYQQTERSVKYGILFIALTFLVFFLFELFSDLKIHPIQYILVGFALSLFYLLVLSLSEHWNFAGAYLTGSIATILLILVYVYRFLVKKSRVMLLAGILSVLYIYLYIIIQLEDLAFLVGALGLFVILAIVMFITRKIDWYNINFSIK